MDNYIRDFKIPFIETKTAESILDCREIIKKGPETSFTLMNNNIRSIAKNFDELNLLLHSFNYCLDCLILTETFKLYNTDIFNIPGYDLLYNQGDFNKNDGVIIYIRSDLNYTYEVINIGEIKAIKLNLLMNNKIIQIVALYRSPSSCPLAFNYHLEQFLINTKEKCDINLLVGDININIFDDNNEYCQQYLNTLSEFGYISAINKFTRIQGETKTCIDHIFIKTNISYDLFTPVVLETQITDHYPTLLKYLSLAPETEHRNYYNKKPEFKNYISYDKLKNVLRSENYHDIYDAENINNAVDLFINKLQLHISNCTNKIKMKRNEIKRNNWITNGLINSINKKNSMHKKLKNNPENNNLLNQYRIYRNKLNELIKKTKTNYYKNQITESNNCPAKMWQCVKDIQGQNNKVNITSIKNSNGEIISNKSEITKHYNTFFSEVGKNLAKKIKQKKYNLPKFRLANSFVITYTDVQEVKKTIADLKLKKAPGVDRLKAETLKEICDYIVEPLTYLINKSLECGIFPDAFKVAMIKPIYKSGDKQEVSNYRPISLISNLAKIYEKILKVRICSFLKKYKIMSDKQYGFMEARSTNDAIADLTAKIYNALDSTNPSLCVFVDLAKAFDTVSHPDLLDTLENIGFRGMFHNLIKSYLTNRKHFVSIDNCDSDLRNVCYGVPQGTVLGPILFCIYVNDLFKIPIDAEIISYADDTAIFFKDTTWESLKCKVERDFKTVINFFNSKLLTINFDKTHYLPFSSYSNGLPNYNIINIEQEDSNMTITSDKTIKYLGITIDCHLKWDVHVNNIVKKLRSLLPKFKYFKQIFDEKHLKIMYHSLVESHIAYGIIGWGGVTNCFLKNLETTQKWILKVIYGKSYDYPSNDLYLDSRVFDPRQLYCEKILTETHKDKNNMKRKAHKYEIRRKEKLIQVPKMRKTIGQRCHQYIGPKIYNSLPDYMTNLTSLTLFKKKVKNWINYQQRYEIHQLIDLKNN